jgi:hypothetical protein
MVPRTFVEQTREVSSIKRARCRLLEMTSYSGGVSWLDVDGPDVTPGMVWSLKSRKRKGERELLIQSSLDEDFSCACTIRQTAGSLRSTIVAETHRCRANSMQRRGLHPFDDWEKQSVWQQRQCETLQTVLRGRYIISIDASVLHDSGTDPCWYVALNWEQEREQQGSKHLYDKLQSTSVPKAVLAVEVKHAVLAFGEGGDSLDKNLEVALHMSRASLAQVNNILRRNTSNTYCILGQVPGEFLGELTKCNGNTDQLLGSFLETSRASFTPEHANMTLVIRKAARYILDVGMCQLKVSQRVLHFWECAGYNLHIKQIGSSAALALFERNLEILRQSLRADITSIRPDSETLSNELLTTADAFLNVASVGTILGQRVHESFLLHTDNEHFWIDILCCSVKSPQPLISNTELRCLPFHRRII